MTAAAAAIVEEGTTNVTQFAIGLLAKTPFQRHTLDEFVTVISAEDVIKVLPSFNQIETIPYSLINLCKHTYSNTELHQTTNQMKQIAKQTLRAPLPPSPPMLCIYPPQEIHFPARPNVESYYQYR